MKKNVLLQLAMTAIVAIAMGLTSLANAASNRTPELKLCLSCDNAEMEKAAMIFARNDQVVRKKYFVFDPTSGDALGFEARSRFISEGFDKIEIMYLRKTSIPDDAALYISQYSSAYQSYISETKGFYITSREKVKFEIDLFDEDIDISTFDAVRSSATRSDLYDLALDHVIGQRAGSLWNAVKSMFKPKGINFEQLDIVVKIIFPDGGFIIAEINYTNERLEILAATDDFGNEIPLPKSNSASNGGSGQFRTSPFSPSHQEDFEEFIREVLFPTKTCATTSRTNGYTTVVTYSCS